MGRGQATLPVGGNHSDSISRIACILYCWSGLHSTSLKHPHAGARTSELIVLDNRLSTGYRESGLCTPCFNPHAQPCLFRHDIQSECSNPSRHCCLCNNRSIIHLDRLLLSISYFCFAYLGYKSWLLPTLFPDVPKLSIHLSINIMHHLARLVSLALSYSLLVAFLERAFIFFTRLYTSHLQRKTKFFHSIATPTTPVEHIRPLHDFDYRDVEPTKYRPFDSRRHVTMGL